MSVGPTEIQHRGGGSLKDLAAAGRVPEGQGLEEALSAEEGTSE